MCGCFWKILMCDCFWKKMCSWYFYVCGCFFSHSIYIEERAAAFEKILTTASKRKMCSCFLELSPLKKIFWSEKQIKLKMMFMYFWLNYCDGNHIERISIAVKNIGHLFHPASQIIEADRLHLFFLSDGTRIDDN